MPGGSGLLEQFIDDWEDVYRSADDMLGHCPNACSNSCYDCLRTYYNQFYHEQLNRHRALDVIRRLGDSPTSANTIEPINEVPDLDGEDEQTNIWEVQLEQMITDEWGFSGFSPQEKIDLPSISAWTKPDLVHRDAQVAVYLDGPHHDDPEQRQQDNLLRNALRSKDGGWDVIEIPIQDAENDQMMQIFRQQIDNSLNH